MLYGYVRTAPEARGLKNLVEEGLFVSIEACAVIDTAVGAAGLSEEEVMRRATDLEAQTGKTIAWLTMFHRHFGRGYSTGSFEFPRIGYFEQVDRVAMTHGIVEQMDFWAREFDSKSLSLFLFGNPYVAIACETAGIPFRLPDTVRFGDYWLWTVNEYYFPPQVEDTFYALEEWDRDIDFTPYQFAVGSFSRVFGLQSWPQILKRIGRFVVSRAIAIMRGRGEMIQTTRQFTRRLLRQREDYTFLTSRSMARLDALEGKTFLYYPMHKEPEFSLHQISPECFDQMSVIASVSRDLPANALLVVKEHPRTLGTRNMDFYRKITDLRNIVMLDVRENGIEISRKAAGIVSIAGTSGLEAAILGKPVITFGRHNLYSILPHVMTVTDQSQLKDYLERILSNEFESEMALDLGKRLVAALRKNAFDMKGLGMHGKFGKELDDPEIIDDAVRLLLDSLNLPNLNVVRRQYETKMPERSTSSI